MPDMKLNRSFLPLLQKHKPIKIAIGGRGSGKSIGFGDIFLMKMDTERADIYCLREFQETVLDSVHRVFRDRIGALSLRNWTIVESKITAPNGASTVYKGASRNPDNIQSAQNFKYSWFEEAHKISQETIDRLLPTIIRNPGAECWFSGNPFKSNDPFSQRFIVPYLHDIHRHGYYEDDLHLIVKVNWRDNPWWNDEQEALRKWDYENLSRAKYNWIWEGDFYDGVEDCLIAPEWFDACVDAHTRLGFDPIGIRIASHDPSDLGGDPKGFAIRQGSVVLDVQAKTDGNVNEGCDWACGLATSHNVDAFTWDCDGLGASLKRQVAQHFQGHNTLLAQYKGSEKVDNPDAMYEPINDVSIQDQLKNKDVFKNKRAQYYTMLRDRMHRTYEAVELGKYHDPDKMISFSSQITDLAQLRSELCSMPVKPNGSGLIELYTKAEMKSKFKMASPNLADCVKMLCRVPKAQTNSVTVKRPQVIRPMNNRISRAQRSIAGMR